MSTRQFEGVDDARSSGEQAYSRRSRRMRSPSPSEGSYHPRASRHSSYQSDPGRRKSRFETLGKGVIAVGLITIVANYVHVWMTKRLAERETHHRRQKVRDFETAKARRRRDEERWERQQQERERMEEEMAEASRVPETRLLGYVHSRDVSRTARRLYDSEENLDYGEEEEREEEDAPPRSRRAANQRSRRARSRSRPPANRD